MYKFRKIIGKYDFPYPFKKIIVRYKKVGYNRCFATDCMLGCQSNQGYFAYLFECATVGRASD